MGNNTPDVVINVVGHVSGVVIFANFLFLILRRSPGRQRGSRLALWAGVLALVWNLASLVVLSIGGQGTFLTEVLATVGFSALSVLPAVLLNISLERTDLNLVRLGYSLSAMAVLVHVLELVGGPDYLHRVGLGLITLGFGLLTVVAVVRITRQGLRDRRQLRSRLLAAMSLFLFAISFVHFSEGESHEAWSTELAFHHAGIPLALFILIQDYRFVLVDAFIRFLANGLLAGGFGLATVLLMPQFGFSGQIVVATLLLASFAAARNGIVGFLTRIVFRQTDPDVLVEQLRADAVHASSEESFLERASETIATAMEAPLIVVDAGDEGNADRQVVEPDSHSVIFPVPVDTHVRARTFCPPGAAVLIPIRLADGGVKELFLGERRGGRRYLSQDLDTLARLSACASEQVERIRKTELQHLAAQAELKALQAQIHPHFLFNALNTLYGIIPREAASARSTLLNLADILRYFLRPETTYIPLEEELRIVRAYLEIEALRLGSKLKIVIDVDSDVSRVKVPILSIEPLVENAVKHGISAVPEGGEIRVEAKRTREGVRIRVLDTGRGFASGGTSSGGDPVAVHFGMGLENVRRRLELCYGSSARLEVGRDAGYTLVSFLAPVSVSVKNSAIPASSTESF